MSSSLHCPYCPYVVPSTESYVLLLHIESLHESPNTSPAPSETPTPTRGSFDPLDYDIPSEEDDPETTYVICPEPDCEEPILLVELQTHMDFHSASNLSRDLPAPPPLPPRPERIRKHRSSHPKKRAPSPPPKLNWLERSALKLTGHSSSFRTPTPEPEPERRHRNRHRHRDDSGDGEPRRKKNRDDDGGGEPRRKKHRRRKPRLGTSASELGPYAHERRMPEWLHTELATAPANETSHVIRLLSLLLAASPRTASASLCHHAVKHVGKQNVREGGFCGYRNIQMMISYIQGAFPAGSHPWTGRIPNVLELQNMIHAGWKKGINSTARKETGGVRGTRKYIGTSEAQTVLRSAGLTVHERYFPREEGSGTQDALLAFVEGFYGGAERGVKVGTKSPMYWQHAGHSMTIVGIEKGVDGELSLLVFDPFWAPADRMRRWAERGRLGSRAEPEKYLPLHRRGKEYLEKYQEFEVMWVEK